MNPRIQEFLVRIQQLEAAIEQEAKTRRQQCCFQRIQARYVRSICSSPGNSGSSSGEIVFM